ncbi:MAG TPA: ATP-dependent helicase [Bacteroidota bacterium]|nr:ATP-dependent helicase [Bacteroidota bacterium]
MKKYTLKKSIFKEPQEAAPEAPSHLRIDYRNQLNPAQYQAVTSVNGPHLIIAGAGTGKTRTITFRVAYLVELGVKPESILLLTFTRRAAQEMLRRASILLDARCEKVAGGTFHSFANLILRQYAPLVDFDSSFTILDQGDAEDVVNLLRTQFKFDTKERRFPRKQTLYGIFSRAVNTLTPVKDILKDDYPHYEDFLDDITKLQAAFEVYKAKHNMMDYDDLLIYLRKLLRDNDRVRRTLSDRYKYVMVDEYQDTNKIQAEIVTLLASAHGNVMVVGDDAQSIYSFRGATVRNILDFPETFPGCVIVKLEENYRSTQPILNLTNEILRRARE